MFSLWIKGHSQSTVWYRWTHYEYCVSNHQNQVTRQRASSRRVFLQHMQQVLWLSSKNKRLPHTVMDKLTTLRNRGQTQADRVSRNQSVLDGKACSGASAVSSSSGQRDDEKRTRSDGGGYEDPKELKVRLLRVAPGAKRAQFVSSDA